jgi:hypothetical protein
VSDWKEYSQSVSMERRCMPLYIKRKWVPCWLWRLVSLPDTVSHVEYALQKAKENFTDGLFFL